MTSKGAHGKYTRGRFASDLCYSFTADGFAAA